MNQLIFNQEAKAISYERMPDLRKSLYKLIIDRTEQEKKFGLEPWSYKDYASYLNCTPRTISRHISVLVALGLITVQRVNGFVTEYFLRDINESKFHEVSSHPELFVPVKKEKEHTIGRNELYPDDGNLSATQKAHNEDVMWRRNMAEMKRDSYDTMATSSIINSIYGGFGNNGFLNVDQKKKQLILGQVPNLFGGFSGLDPLISSVLGFTGNAVMSKFTAKGEMAKMTAVMNRVAKTEAFTDWMDQIGVDSKKYKKMKKKDRQKLMDRFMRTDESIVDDVEVKGKDGQVRKQRVNYKTRAMKELSKDTAFMGGLPLKGLGVLAAVGAVEKLVGAIKNLGSESIKSFENIQSLQTQLSVVFGSEVSSKQAFNEIEAYAKKSPFGVETMTQQAILLKQSGVYGSDLMDVMGRIGDLASGNAEKMRSISEVYARILSSTTVTARDMRQLANAGVPSYRALTESFKNMSEEERSYRGLPKDIQQSQIRSMLQGGKVTSEDFRRMIELLTNEGGTFYGAVERGSKTLLARKQNLSDAKEMARAAAGEWLTRLGGQSTNDSLYGKILDGKEKIYSRKRIVFPKLKISKNVNFKKIGHYKGENNNKTLNKLVKTLIIVVIAVYIASKIINMIEPTIDVLSINLAKGVATQIANEQATIAMEGKNYDDISTIIRDSSGKIQMVKMNMGEVNQLTSDVAIKIQEGINNYDKFLYCKIFSRKI